MVGNCGCGYPLAKRMEFNVYNILQVLSSVGSLLFDYEWTVCWVWPTTNEILVDYYHTFRLLLSELVLGWDYITTASFFVSQSKSCAFPFRFLHSSGGHFFPLPTFIWLE